MADQTPDPWAVIRLAIIRRDYDTRELCGLIADALDAERQQHQQEVAVLEARVKSSELVARLRENGTCPNQPLVDDIERWRVECEQAMRQRDSTQGVNNSLRKKLAEHQQTIQQQAAQIEELRQARDEEARAFQCAARDRDICRQKRVDLEAQIATLTQEVAMLRGAIAADAERLRLEGARVGIEMGCDTPHWMAEEILALRASRPTEGEQGRLGNYYGRRLTASVDDGQVVVSIGVQTLAHAVAYADWANPFDEAADDYIRTFAIADAGQFAKDVVNAMLAEREDGSTPLSDFLDKMSQAAIEDGSLGLHEDEHRIKHGETAPCETWAEGEQGAPQ